MRSFWTINMARSILTRTGKFRVWPIYYKRSSVVTVHGHVPTFADHKIYAEPYAPDSMERSRRALSTATIFVVCALVPSLCVWDNHNRLGSSCQGVCHLLQTVFIECAYTMILCIHTCQVYLPGIYFDLPVQFCCIITVITMRSKSIGWRQSCPLTGIRQRWPLMTTYSTAALL